MAQNPDQSSSSLTPVILMVFAQVLNTVMNILYKFVTVTEVSLKVFIAYRLMFSAVFMVPLALILERNTRPRLTWVVLVQAFVSGLIGAALPQNLYILSLSLTSPTFLAAMLNLMPATTFVVALCFRQEKLSMRCSTIAKIVGTLIGIGGAMLFTFYKGHVFTFWSTHINLLGHYHNNNITIDSSSTHMNNPTLGLLAGFSSSLCFSLWLIVQVKMLKNYPCPYSCTALMTIMGSIQAVIFALWVDRDWKQWKMGWNISLWTAAYSKRGPLFVSIFSPLTFLMVAFASSLLLGEDFSLGSVLGGVLIVCGLYMVLWGKSREISSPLLPPNSLPIAPLISKSIDQTSVCMDDEAIHTRTNQPDIYC